MDINAQSSNHNILVVDDDDMVRRVIVSTLSKIGYNTSTATDGTAALKMAAELRPAVMMVDLRMPGIDGHTIMRRARAMGIDAAFVVISGSKDPEDIIDALRNGACDYLPKPFSFADLVAATGRAVEAYEKGRRAESSAPTAADAGPLIGAAATPAAPVAVGAPAPAPAPSVSAPPASATTSSTTTAALRPPAGAGATLSGNDPLFASILRRVQEGEILIPPVPTVVLELRRLLADVETPLDTVTALIERDQRLTAQLLRLSNTTPYARGAQNTSLRTAVSRIGLRHIQSLVETVFAHSACTIRDPVLAPLQESIWRFSVARAVTMRLLAEAQGPPRLDPELAYLGGLFCDVGASFLLWIISERNGTAGQGPKLSAEDCMAFVGQNHPGVGSAVLSRWSVDPMLPLLARSHHGQVLSNPVNPYAVLECVAVQAAEGLTGAADLTGPPRDAALVAECARRLKAPPVEVLLARIQPTYEAIMNILA
ncbi:MAG TPA: HDOD domain-containing protein [Polyangia bacterium]|nr:HDOD domain-containing protein [Polyangia bacterium]